MQVLQGMSVDRMVIILPSALVAMYLIISIQKKLSESNNRYLGLILPVACFIASTVLAVRPLIVGDPSQEGLVVFCIRMWLTFNIATLVFGFQYFRERRVKKALRDASAGNAPAEEPSADEPEEKPAD